MNDSDNLLSLLYRWAHRQYENFTTEVLAHLIRHFLAAEPPLGIKLLSYLTDGRLSLSPNLADTIEVRTQVTEDMERPDIEIKGPARLAYVEVKLEAGLGHQQLSRYRCKLEERCLSHTALVLITQFAPELTVNECPDVCYRWYEVAEYIDCLARDRPFASPDTRFLVQQFLDFLHWRGLVMDRVGWELDAGVRAYRNLMKMIEAACNTRRFDRNRGEQDRPYDGYNVAVDGAKVWLGVYYDSPTMLTFESHEWLIAADADIRAGFGAVESSRWTSNRIKWVHRLVLDSEDVHFFARSAPSQRQCIEEFLAVCIQSLPKIKADPSSPVQPAKITVTSADGSPLA